MIKSLIKKGEYFDSVSLMIAGKELEKIDGVDDASIVMATQANMDILKNSGLYKAEFEKYSDTDLLVVIDIKDESNEDAIFDEVKGILASIRNKKSSSKGYEPKSLSGAIEEDQESNLVLISLAGQFAGDEAMKALKSGLNVMLFSDNVSLETEIELKKYALAKDLLVMGPDCGTAIINGVPLAFSNVVNQGSIGIVSASGTGLQEVSSIISDQGFGISQAIGTGGRDVKKEVGGMMFLSAMDILNEDENTEIIVLVSKPPHPEVLAKIKEKIKTINKPIISVLLGAKPDSLEGTKAIYAETLEKAALYAVALSEDKSLDSVEKNITERNNSIEKIAEEEFSKIGKDRKYVRGLFSGGTLCDETLIFLQKECSDIFSNRASKAEMKLKDLWKSNKNTLLDMGEDDFTVGRLHPMMDFELRNKRIIQEAEDNETAIILFDLVLGYGAHQEPIEAILPTLLAAKKKSLNISYVCSITGTEGDPQNKERVKNILEENDIVVMESNAAASIVTSKIIRKLSKRR